MAPRFFVHVARLLGMVVAVAALTTKAQEVYPFKKLIIADSLNRVAALPDDIGGNTVAAVVGVAALDTPEFARLVQPYVGQPIDSQLLQSVTKAISQYIREHDRIIADIQILNNQNIKGGCLRLAVVLGTYNQLVLRGNRWFSRRLIEQKLGIKPGDEVRLSTLEEAVAWANANPFRQIKVLINRVPNEPGKADLIVGVQEVAPFRVAASYDADGMPILGRNRYTGSLQFGNIWGLDHQATYQFITSDSLRRYQGHVVDYVMPLPWRHNIELTGSFVKLRPELPGSYFGQEGQSTTADLRYRIPFGTGSHTGEFISGIAFKQSNNNLEFGGLNVSAVKTDTFQAVFGYTSIRRDQKGAWLFGATLTASPGDINSRNSDANFQPGYRGSAYHIGRLGAKARYISGSGSIQRLLTLDKGWDLFSRLSVQLASTNLLGSEQLAIGGMNSVRGFDPNILAGDEGYVFNNDLQTPAWKKTLSFLPKKMGALETRFALFYDAAEVKYVKHFPRVNTLGQQIGWDDDYLHPIASAGVGIRMSIPGNFSLTFDYGWHTTHLSEPVDQHGRGHIKVVLSY